MDDKVIHSCSISPMSQPLLLSNWRKYAFSDSISADPKSHNSFSQGDTSRSETRFLKRGKEESSSKRFCILSLILAIVNS